MKSKKLSEQIIKTFKKNGFVLSDLVDLELISHRIVDSEVFLHYQVR